MFIYILQNTDDDNVQSLNNVDAFTCAVGVDDYILYSKSSSLQVDIYIHLSSKIPQN